MSAEFNPIHEPKIYEGIEAQQRLAELGVPLEVVREAGREFGACRQRGYFRDSRACRRAAQVMDRDDVAFGHEARLCPKGRPCICTASGLQRFSAAPPARRD